MRLFFVLLIVLNSRLVNGLNALSLNADDYLLRLGQTIFDLMGYEQTGESEQVFERYMELCEQALLVDISGSTKNLDKLALQIYKELVIQKPKLCATSWNTRSRRTRIIITRAISGRPCPRVCIIYLTTCGRASCICFKAWVRYQVLRLQITKGQ